MGQVFLTLKYLIFNSKVQQLDLVTVVTETIETVYNSGLRVIVQYMIFYLLAICIVMVSESVGSSGINVYNCRMYSAGHDGVAFLSDSRNCRMYNCDVQVQTNTGVRIDNSDNCEVDHNTFTGSAGSGWCCVQLQNSLTNANVHHNIMHDFRGSSRSAGIGNVHASGSINVHDNVMWNVSPYIEIGSGPGIF